MTAVRGAPQAGDVPSSLHLAFCPSPPLLLPAVAGRAAADTAPLRRACAEAVEGMLAGGPEVVVVVGDGATASVRYGAGDAGSLRGFGVDLVVPFAGRARRGGRELPLAHTVGAWLLDVARFDGLRLGVAPADLSETLGDLPGSVGVLAMGDGSARRSLKAPGHMDEAAAPFDAAVAAALAAGDAAALACLDPAEARRLMVAGVGTWRAVGAALAVRPVVSARLHYDDAPFGVGYLVADWTTAERPR